jgi:monovalent cation/hydrogen antiporter
VAVGAVAANSFSLGTVAPTFILAVGGSVLAGPVLAWLFLRVTERVQHVPTSIILSFLSTFGVWISAERVGLSGVLTMVCYAVMVAETRLSKLPREYAYPPTLYGTQPFSS